ncbi:hypothetical protein FGL74_07750 [Leuconostoc koreense]|nr:hypothetical protein FGL74_07750 [Leuconostoc mesenteroides]QGM25494.1 hypothetical protein GJV51_05710 [Leuconostoc mesenteroides subsp. mesenteroides]
MKNKNSCICKDTKVDRYKHSMISKDNLSIIEIKKSDILNAIDILESEVFCHWSIIKLRFPQICIPLGPITIKVIGEKEYIHCLHDLIALLYVRNWNQMYSRK